jgi:hypothetical protein
MQSLTDPTFFLMRTPFLSDTPNRQGLAMHPMCESVCPYHPQFQTFLPLHQGLPELQLARVGTLGK